MGIRPLLLSLRKNKFIALIVVLQIALTLAAVSHSVFSASALLKDWNEPSGLDEENLIIARSQFFIDNPDRESAIIQDLRKLSELPGVQYVTTANQIPFAANAVSNVFKETGDQAQRYLASTFEFDGVALDVLGVQLISGRTFYANEIVRGQLSLETKYPSVIMISEALALEMFGEENALGKTLWPVKNNQPAEIIGIYSNFMTGEILNRIGKSYNSIIRPMSVWSPNRFDPGYLMRVEPGTAEALLEDARDVIYQLNGRYLYNNEVLTRTKKRIYDGRSSQAFLMLAISTVLVLITAFGIAGLASFLVKQRQKQIGIRRALGATKMDILRYFLLENSLLTSLGLIFGVIVTMSIAIKFPTLGGNGFLRYDLMLAVALFLWIINIIAVYLPAKRASNIEPAKVIG